MSNITSTPKKVICNKVEKNWFSSKETAVENSRNRNLQEANPNEGGDRGAIKKDNRYKIKACKKSDRTGSFSNRSNNEISLISNRSNQKNSLNESGLDFLGFQSESKNFEMQQIKRHRQSNNRLIDSPVQTQIK